MSDNDPPGTFRCPICGAHYPHNHHESTSLCTHEVPTNPVGMCGRPALADPADEDGRPYFPWRCAAHTTPLPPPAETEVDRLGSDNMKLRAALAIANERLASGARDYFLKDDLARMICERDAALEQVAALTKERDEARQNIRDAVASLGEEERECEQITARFEALTVELGEAMSALAAGDKLAAAWIETSGDERSNETGQPFVRCKWCQNSPWALAAEAIKHWPACPLADYRTARAKMDAIGERAK